MVAKRTSSAHGLPVEVVPVVVFRRFVNNRAEGISADSFVGALVNIDNIAEEAIAAVLLSCLITVIGWYLDVVCNDRRYWDTASSRLRARTVVGLTRQQTNGSNSSASVLLLCTIFAPVSLDVARRRIRPHSEQVRV